MLGAGVDPRLFVQDYSGFAQAGAMQGQSLANIGEAIGAASKGFGEYKEKQKQAKQQITASKQTAKAIAQLVPELQPVLKEQLGILDNEEIPLSERQAVASSIADILNLGTAEIKSRAMLGLEREKMGMQQEKIAQDILQSQYEQSSKQDEAMAKATGIVDAIEILVNEAESKGDKPVIPRDRVEQIRSMVLDNPQAGLGYAQSVYDALGSTMKKRVDETIARFVTMGVEGGEQTFQVTPEGLKIPTLAPEVEAQINASTPPVGGEMLTESTGGVLPDKSLVGFKPQSAGAKESSKQEKFKMLRDARQKYKEGKIEEAADLLNAAGVQGMFNNAMTVDDVKEYFSESDMQPAEASEKDMQRKPGESYADWKKRTGQ